MIYELNIELTPKQFKSIDFQKEVIAKKLKLPISKINDIEQIKLSLDARNKNVVYKLSIRVFTDKDNYKNPNYIKQYKSVKNAPPIIIIGAGPAGLFAGLRAIELGYKSIILERGKDVKERRRSLKNINVLHKVDEDCNYCFGEGGAGTYSDGKLYTRSKKRGSIDRFLDTLIVHGAIEDIKVNTHPHIGTNKLPKIIKNIRESILQADGLILFDTRVTDFIIKGNKIKGVVTAKGEQIYGKAVILATGHSARDIYELLHSKNILIEVKPFAMGVRIEHNQKLINNIQYHCHNEMCYLPSAAYKLVHQSNGRGVYSFCMCPGGFIVASATAQEEVVVNGMSTSERNNKFANSGMVVAIELEDLKKYEKHGALAGLRFQQEVERNAWITGGKTQVAPAQRMADFVKGRLSNDLNDCSYIPGITSVPLHETLPQNIASRLQDGFINFNKKMKDYFTNEANILGVESRTSSPVRIPRDRQSLEHPQIKNLYPCGEGSGFAGGIISAAIDGERCIEAFAKKVK